MALQYTRQVLSGSTNGRPVSVVDDVAPGTTIHEVVATATTEREEIYLFAHMYATTDERVIVTLGGTATSDEIVMDLTDGDGLHVIVPGITLVATTSIVRAWATGGPGEVAISGWVNRATEGS